MLGGVISVQFGGALAATLVPEIGAGGSVLLRIAFSALILVPLVRPRVRGHSRKAWLTVVAFGVALGLMNWSFYGSLAHLPLGVAVTVEFLGPLVLTTVLSRRPLDFLAVLAAGAGVLLISEALTVPLEDLSWIGLGLAATAGVLWAAYILLSSRTGAEFERLDGLALALVVSTVVVLPAGLGSSDLWTAEHVLKGLGLAVLSSLLPYSLELLALRRLAANVFGILLSLEPAVAALAGLIVLGQRLDAAPGGRAGAGRAGQRHRDGGETARGARPDRVDLTGLRRQRLRRSPAVRRAEPPSPRTGGGPGRRS